MKLYSKKLNSLEELKKEKYRLQKEQSEIDLMPSISWDMMGLGKLSASKSTSKEGNDIIDMIAGFIEEGSIATIAANVFQSVRKFKVPKGVRNTLYPIVKDIALSYARWKAIELGYKGMRMLIEKRRNKK